jgi:hypothetical protein
MSGRHWFQGTMLALVTCWLLAGAGWAQSQQSQRPSLAEVAKQKSTTKKAKRVITNDDIPSRPPEAASAPASGASGAAAAETGKAEGPKTAAPAKDAKQLEQMKEKLDLVKNSQEAAKSTIERYEQQVANEPDERRREMFQGILDGAKRRQEALAKERSELETSIAAGQKPGQQAQPQAPQQPPKP